MVIAFNKPYGVLSQFTSDGSGNRPLSEFSLPKEVYPIGRLDSDSEGLLLLSDEIGLTDQLLNPKNQHPRRYISEVERVPEQFKLHQLETGIIIESRKTLPCKVTLIDKPEWLWERIPPVRFRKSVPTAWLQLELIEGKNRQVRKMTAHIGHPTLRLIRVKIGNFTIGDLALGTWRKLTSKEIDQLFSKRMR
ncbi:MAG: pseudouridine synthase [Chloroherpetonaceae bacterium]|nr:pseudouridine synthase [Chloroherpetonaceae bacterium]